jgi:DNA-binding MarR family transcriptional regulator
VDLSDDEITRLRVALSKISRQLSRQVPGEGVTQTQVSVLGTLSRAPSVSLSELADAEGLNPTMLSRVVAKLETMGLIRRFADSADLRVAHVAITPVGAELHQRVKAARTALFAAHVGALDADVRELLGDALPAIVALA